LPSLRLDTSAKLLDSLPSKRKTALTFAPEAGSQRLRDAINKNISEEEMMDAFSVAFRKGLMNLKLYFMIGLPSETAEDVAEISGLVNRIYQLGRKVAGKPPRIRVSVNTFVPKPHTACQWSPQDSESQILDKHQVLRYGLRQSAAHFSYQDPKVSMLETIMARGDRRLGKVILAAWRSGCKFDAWREYFKPEAWQSAFAVNGLDPAFYAYRQRPLDEVLPWVHIDIGVTQDFLKREYEKIFAGTGTADCRYESCQACGLQRWSTGCQRKPAPATS
jgi:radical SAM superfamily enzyme YgiQ (UPF0313 family)